MNEAKIKIIDINITNIELLKSLYIDFMDETNTGRPTDFDKAAKKFISDAEGYLSIILRNEVPVGFIEYRKLPRKLRDNKSIIEITSLFVEAEFRRFGLGKDLIYYVKEFAKNSGAYSIVLYSGLELDNAHRFYERVGFSKSAYYFKMPVEI